MSDVSVVEYKEKANFTLLPISHLDPNDYSYIYSKILFFVNQAKQLNIRTLCVTFDLSLRLEDLDIFSAESFDMVLICACFHTMMSFVGSIDTLMNRSGHSQCL